MIVFWRKRKRRVKPRVPSERERQTVHEYRNFFRYNGESQDRSPAANSEMLPDGNVKVSTVLHLP